MARLHERGIAFTVASSRPPVGLRGLVEPLGLTLPMGAFNGSTVVRPDLTPMRETFIPRRRPGPPPTGSRRRALTSGCSRTATGSCATPTVPIPTWSAARSAPGRGVVADLAPFLGRAAKLVGVSRDHAGLAACETALAAEIGDGAAVHPLAGLLPRRDAAGRGQGRFVARLAAELGLATDEVVTLGDMANDVAMFPAAVSASRWATPTRR